MPILYTILSYITDIQSKLTDELLFIDYKSHNYKQPYLSQIKNKLKFINNYLTNRSNSKLHLISHEFYLPWHDQLVHINLKLIEIVARRFGGNRQSFS